MEPFLLHDGGSLLHQDRFYGMMKKIKGRGKQMRKIAKSILTITVVLFTLCAVVLTAFNFGIKLVDRSGWSQNQSGAVYYLDWEGKPQTGWKTINGNRYYFDPQRHGSMTKGWLEIQDAWYYFDDSGIMQTGWLDLMGSRFYLLPDGTMVTGWKEVDSNHYYFDDEGEMQVGWLDLDGRRFYLGVDGRVNLGWQDTAQGRCYLTLDGTVYSGWQEVQEQRYFFNEEGFLTYGWLSYENDYYYLDAQGVMKTGWMETDAGRYYLDEDGKLKTGWLDLAEGRYFLGTDGIMDTGWVSVGGSRYYLRENGLMYTGWLEQDGHQYYMGSSGAMSVGQVAIDGVNEFFTSQGWHIVLVNRESPVPEGYTPDLVEFEGHQIDRVCVEPLKKLLEASVDAGHTYLINYAYRSPQQQVEVWDLLYQELLEQAQEEPSEETSEEPTQEPLEEQIRKKVDLLVAPPNYSEHQLGLAVDIQGEDELYFWLRDNAWRYGFIVRYPETKTDITGYAYEPWHVRYVGLELAQELYERDMCLEEYMEKLSK